VLEGSVVPTGLEDVARMAGIALPAAVTVEADRDHLLPDSPPVHFRADTWNEHEITGDLRGASVIAGMVRPIVRAEGSEVGHLAAALQPAGLGRDGHRRAAPHLHPLQGPDDVPGPSPRHGLGGDPDVARRAEGVSRARRRRGQLEVVGRGTSTSGLRASVANANLAEAIVGWLTTRRELVNIPSRPVERANLLVSERDLARSDST
jgi:hypothetical protein